MKNIVELIHNEIDTAQDRLLLEVKNIIENTSINLQKEDETLISKVERLKKLGFTSIEEIEKAEKIKEKINSNKDIIFKNKKQAELIEYYKKEYPFHKFLTIDEFDKICNKYNLIYAPVSSYKKNVPEKNLKDIENSKQLKNEDLENIFFKLNGKRNFIKWMADIGFPNCIISKKQLRDLIIQYYGNCGIDWDDPRKSATGLYTIHEKIPGNYHHDSCELIDKSGYFIAAPKSHFNLKNLTQKGLGFFSVKYFEKPDPIVFQYCRGNMIRIETKWGLECEDPSLTNPIDN